MTSLGTTFSSLPWFVHGRALAHSDSKELRRRRRGGRGRGRRVLKKTLLVLQAPLAGDRGVTAEIQSVTSLAKHAQNPHDQIPALDDVPQSPGLVLNTRVSVAKGTGRKSSPSLLQLHRKPSGQLCTLQK